MQLTYILNTKNKHYLGPTAQSIGCVVNKARLHTFSTKKETAYSRTMNPKQLTESEDGNDMAYGTQRPEDDLRGIKEMDRRYDQVVSCCYIHPISGQHERVY